MKSIHMAALLLTGISSCLVVGVGQGEAAQKARLTFEPMTPAKPVAKPAPVVAAPVLKQQPSGLLVGKPPASVLAGNNPAGGKLVSDGGGSLLSTNSGTFVGNNGSAMRSGAGIVAGNTSNILAGNTSNFRAGTR